jgi:DNA-binding MarR family transcriptional regulator
MDGTVPPTVAEHNSSSEHPHGGHPHTHADPDEAEQHQLVWLLLEFTRAFGLHRPDLGLPGGPVSFSEALALAELVRAPAALSQQQLADRLRLEKSTVSRLTASLQQRGLVTRARDPANRRWSKVALTPQGQATAAELIARFHRRHQRLFAAMRPTDRQALATGLTALVRAAGDDAGTHASAGKAGQPREGG